MYNKRNDNDNNIATATTIARKRKMIIIYRHIRMADKLSRRNASICEKERASKLRYIRRSPRPGCTGIAGRAKSTSVVCVRACVREPNKTGHRAWGMGEEGEREVGGLPAGTKLISLSVFCRATNPVLSLSTGPSIIGPPVQITIR